MKIPSMPPALNEIGFVLTFFLFITFLMNLYNAASSLEKSLPPVDLKKAAVSDSAGVTSDEGTVITISKGKDTEAILYVEKDRITLKELPKLIEARRPKEVLLRADREVPHGKVVDVMLKCQEYGVRRIGFAYEELHR